MRPRLYRAPASFGVELDRLVEVFDGTVGFAPHAMSNTAIEKGSGLVRIELDGVVVVLDGALKVALGPVGGGAAVKAAASSLPYAVPT